MACTQNVSVASYPQIVLFGDSITQSMTMTIQAWLQTRYSRRVDIINRGFGGYTSQEGVSLLPQIVPTPYPESLPKIKLLCVFFGANDVFCPVETSEVPRVSLENFSSNISSIITYPAIVEQGVRIVLITPPAVDEHMLPHNRITAERIAKYASVTRGLAEKYGLPLVDCWKVFQKHAGWTGEVSTSSPLPGDKRAPKNNALGSLLTDGLHLTDRGYELLYHEIVSIIDREIPDASVDNMPVIVSQDFPGYIWEDFGAAEQVTKSVGYPTIQADRDRVDAKKAALEKSIGMTIEEFFGLKKPL